MKALSIRACTVHPGAESLAEFFDKPGHARADLGDGGGAETSFSSAVFPAGDSWIELWPDRHNIPGGTMLQVVVNDADAFADNARQDGLDPQGPMDARGERICSIGAPTGLRMSFQSKLGDS